MVVVVVVVVVVVEAEMAKTSGEEMKLRVYSSMLQGAVTQGSSPSSP